MLQLRYQMRDIMIYMVLQTNTLLLILIGLLFLLIGLVFLLLFRRITPENDKEALIKFFEENKQTQSFDYYKLLNDQLKEIDLLKDTLNERLSLNASNQKETLSQYLYETKSKLDQVEQVFIKESANQKYQTEQQIRDLIDKNIKEINLLKETLTSEIAKLTMFQKDKQQEDQVKTQKEIELQIDKLKEQVKLTLEGGFIKNEQAIQSFIEKTASIEASTRQIEQLKTEIARFNDLLSNQKSRGNFGEDVLDRILENMFGFQSKSLYYDTQVSLVDQFNLDKEIYKERLVIDFLFKIKTEHGILPLPIDAKFPYTNYVSLFDERLTAEERNDAKKRFRIDMKARLNEVKRYIIEGHTAPYAMMFIPAEAVFIDLFKEFPDIIEESRTKHIIIASPNLVVSLIQILSFILRDYEIKNNQNELLNLINYIHQEFIRLSDRVEEHKKIITKLVDSSKKLDITTSKLSTALTEAVNFSDQIESNTYDIIKEEGSGSDEL